jgi:gas vesicle protein
MSDNESNSGYLWFLAGAVLGASVALLYAPKTGPDTRNYLSDVADDSKDALTTSGKDMLDKGKDLYDRGRQLAEEAADLFDRGRKMVKG